MRRKFNSALQAGADEEKAAEKKQDKLKKKFGISGKNVIVVERTNTFKFVIKIIGVLLRFIASVVIIALAFVGLAALFYDGPRHELLIILNVVLREINQVIPMMKVIG